MDPNQDLVNAALQGSQEAYTAIYRILSRPAKAVGWRILHLRDPWMDDFVHDASTKVIMNLRRFNGRSLFMTWAVAVMRNVALETYRSRKKCPSFTFINDDEENLYEVPSPQCLEEEVNIRLECGRAFELMRCGERVLLGRAYLDGYSAAEIAAMGDLTVPAVKACIMRARRRLRQELEVRR